MVRKPSCCRYSRYIIRVRKSSSTIRTSGLAVDVAPPSVCIPTPRHCDCSVGRVWNMSVLPSLMRGGWPGMHARAQRPPRAETKEQHRCDEQDLKLWDHRLAREPEMKQRGHRGDIDQTMELRPLAPEPPDGILRGGDREREQHDEGRHAERDERAHDDVFRHLSEVEE